MDADLRLFLELIRTGSALAVPIVLSFAAYHLNRRQKFFEAVMTEKVKHYSHISPVVNQIFAYRFRVGDFLDREPETILEAKRKADHEFWTFEYIWSNEFRQLYHEFMNDSFKVWGAEGTKALIRADGTLYRIKPKAESNWAGFTGEAVDRKVLGALYNDLKAAIARDLGFKMFNSQLAPRK